MKMNYFVGILLAMQWIVAVSTRNGRVPTCCTEISNYKVKDHEIESYLRQNGAPCRIKAVRFYLINNIIICSDPEDAWAKRAIKKLDERKSRKVYNTPTSSTSTSWTESTTRTSSPGTRTEITMTTPKATTQIMTTKVTTTTANKTLKTHIKTISVTMTTESAVTMTTPKGTITTQKPTTHITHRPSTKQSLEYTNKIPQWTTTQVMTTDVTTTTAVKPLTTDIKRTSMTMTTEIPVTTTTPKATSSPQKPTTHITHTATAKEVSGNTRTPWTSTMEKSSTATVTPQKPRCPPPKHDKPKAGPGNIPWTVRRLRKKSKKGLRRAQMNSWSNTECVEVKN